MENLEINRSDHSLSIRIYSDGFSLSILDSAGVVLVKRNVSAFLFQMQKEDIVALLETKMGVTPTDYNNVQLTVESDLYVFVPAPIFEIRNVDDYFYFQHEKNKQHIVLFNRIPSWETIDIFSIPLELNDALNVVFQDSAAVHHHLSHFLSEKIKTKEDCVSVCVRSQVLDAVVFKQGTLSLINSFNYRTAEDFTYFVLNIFDQLKLDTEKVAVKLYQRNDSPNFKEMVSMYVKKCDVFNL